MSTTRGDVAGNGGMGGPLLAQAPLADNGCVSSLTVASRFGEVVEASVERLVGQCHRLYEAPPLGALARAGDSIFAVVDGVSTASIDPGRQVIARGTDAESEEDIYAEHPQLERLLRTEVTLTVIGYEDGERIFQHLPPQPPRIHTFLHRCSDDEARRFMERTDFLALLLSSGLRRSAFVPHWGLPCNRRFVADGRSAARCNHAPVASGRLMNTPLLNPPPQPRPLRNPRRWRTATVAHCPIPLRPPTMECRHTANQRTNQGRRPGAGGANYRNIMGGKVIPRRVKQATAIKTPLETPDLSCISGKFSLVRECTTGELLTRNSRGTSPLLRGWGREVAQGPRRRERRLM